MLGTLDLNFNMSCMRTVMLVSNSVCHHYELDVILSNKQGACFQLPTVSAFHAAVIEANTEKTIHTLLEAELPGE